MGRFLHVGTVSVSLPNTVVETSSKGTQPATGCTTGVDLVSEDDCITIQRKDNRCARLYLGFRVDCQGSMSFTRAFCRRKALLSIENDRDTVSELHIVEHLGRLVQRGMVLCSGELSSNKGSVDFNISIDFDAWKPCISGAVLLLHLKERGEGETRRSEYERLHTSTQEFLGNKTGGQLFSLRTCVTALPPPCDADGSLYASPYVQEMNVPSRGVFPLHLLPEEVMFRMLGFLDTKSLQCLASTCRFYRSIAREITPGLLLKLYPHQRAAIRWMMEREGLSGEVIDHPCWKFFDTIEGSFWGNTSTGMITEDPPDTIEDFKGGFLCDDPGLGKTVTCIGLIVRTKGHLPMPKEDEGDVTWISSHDVKHKYGYLSVSPQLSSHESDRQRSKRRKIAAANKFSPFKHAAQTMRSSNHSRVADINNRVIRGDLFEEKRVDTNETCASSDIWLQCDLCDRWRRCPPLYKPDNDVWCCYIHPVPRMRSCSIVAEALDEEEEVVGMMGWVQESEPTSRMNVEFYKDTLSSHSELFSVYGRYKHKGRTILHWLMSKEPEFFRGGFTLPGWAANPPGYGQFLHKLGFVPTNNAYSDLKRTENRRPSGYSRSSLTEHDWLSWVKPNSFFNMLPDIEALREALKYDPAESRIKIYISPATLIVVPPELVQHWKYQLFLHTAPGCLRVTVYDTGQTRKTLPQYLAWEHDIVITTFSVLSTEWNSKDPLKCSPLAQVYWSRIVLDEGHALGSLGVTSRLQMVTSLKAESRWCLTGTPVQSNKSSTLATMRQIQPILAFLHDEYLGLLPSWQEAIEKPIKIAPEVSIWRMFLYFSRTMARSSKSSLRTLPKLQKKITQLDFTATHAASYSSLIDLVRFNLITSDWFDPDHKESLMSKSQASRATSFLFNVALACNVAGVCDLQVSNEDLWDTLELLSDRQGLQMPSKDTFISGPPYLDEIHPLRRIEDTLCHGGICDTCSQYYRILFVTPCACITCVDCTAIDRYKCSHCGEPYTMHASTDPTRLLDNPHPKWDVPKELIEFQPAYAQRGAEGKSEGAWQPMWKETDSSKCVYLIKRLKGLGIIPQNTDTSDAFNGDDEEPNKAIVFTQFWHHALLIERVLNQHASRRHIALYRKQMSQMEKASEINRFRKDPDCRVMLMDESGALGLDLSFVNYVFLMEPIPNASLEDQVISRAHRMGATRQVLVETIIMARSIEEHMAINTPHQDDKHEKNSASWNPDTLIRLDMATKEKEHAESFKRQQRNIRLMSLHRPSNTL